MAESSVCYHNRPYNHPTHWNHPIVCASIIIRVGYDCCVMAGMLMAELLIPQSPSP